MLRGHRLEEIGDGGQGERRLSRPWTAGEDAEAARLRERERLAKYRRLADPGLALELDGAEAVTRAREKPLDGGELRVPAYDPAIHLGCPVQHSPPLKYGKSFDPSRVTITRPPRRLRASSSRSNARRRSPSE